MAAILEDYSVPTLELPIPCRSLPLSPIASKLKRAKASTALPKNSRKGKAVAVDKVPRKQQTRKKWSATEDALLKKFVEEYGPTSECWVEVSKAFETKSATNQSSETNDTTFRNQKQCRERWFNQLDPSVRKGGWTHEEDCMIVAMQKRYGNKWSVIANELDGRTDNTVKNHWHCGLKDKVAEVVGFPLYPRIDAEVELLCASRTKPSSAHVGLNKSHSLSKTRPSATLGSKGKTKKGEYPCPSPTAASIGQLTKLEINTRGTANASPIDMGPAKWRPRKKGPFSPKVAESPKTPTTKRKWPSSCKEKTVVTKKGSKTPAGKMVPRAVALTKKSTTKPAGKRPRVKSRGDVPKKAKPTGQSSTLGGCEVLRDEMDTAVSPIFFGFPGDEPHPMADVTTMDIAEYGETAYCPKDRHGFHTSGASPLPGELVFGGSIGPGLSPLPMSLPDTEQQIFSPIGTKAEIDQTRQMPTPTRRFLGIDGGESAKEADAEDTSPHHLAKDGSMGTVPGDITPIMGIESWEQLHANQNEWKETMSMSGAAFF